jgi:hypothetical protein
MPSAWLGSSEFKGAKQEIVPLLLAHLEDSDNAWLGAALGLERLLTQNEGQTLYVPALLKALNHPDPTIRANAGMFLKRINSEGAGKG